MLYVNCGLRFSDYSDRHPKKSIKSCQYADRSDRTLSNIQGWSDRASSVVKGAIAPINRSFPRSITASV
jgi:hypothetical protein